MRMYLLHFGPDGGQFLEDERHVPNGYHPVTTPSSARLRRYSNRFSE